MQTNTVQMWRNGVSRFKPSGETIRTRDYDVTMIHPTTAKQFVCAHHYSHAFPASRRCYGLFRGESLCGVAVYSVPMHTGVLRGLPDPESSTELGRLVLLDQEPTNSESWFIARTFDLLRSDGFTGVVSFSDPVPRCDQSGQQVFRGHIGQIYQASNAIYCGTATARTIHLLPDGSVMSARTISKIRACDTGWKYGVDLLTRAGATQPNPAWFTHDTHRIERLEWLKLALQSVTRSIRHTGNHKYLFGLTKQVKRHLPSSLPYPRFTTQST